MAYKIKKTIPKRRDVEYEEIESFEDFELINNAFYEMGIRTDKFKKLTKMFAYCDDLSNKITEIMKWEDSLKDIKSEDDTNNEKNVFNLIKKTPKENFEEALKELESNNEYTYNKEIYKLLELDFESFEEKVALSFLEDKTNEELINHYSYIETFLDTIPKVIADEFYIDFYSYYYDDKESEIQKDIEYEESSATSLYIKREYKKDYYIETVIDKDNEKITRTLYPLFKRKLLIEHIPTFLSNHLILYKQTTQFIENFFKNTQVKLKKQTALADAFFCYDYYHYRLEKVTSENKRRQKQNFENVILQDAIASIKSIDNDTFLSYPLKKEHKAPYEEVVQYEELKELDVPTLNKEYPSYVFDESKFRKSGINRSTALKYYQWIKPYIDGKYIEIINTTHLL